MTWDLDGITWIWTESDAVIAKRAQALADPEDLELDWSDQ